MEDKENIHEGGENIKEQGRAGDQSFENVKMQKVRNVDQEEVKIWTGGC